MSEPNKFSEPDLSQLAGDPAPVSPDDAGPDMAEGSAGFRRAHDKLVGLPGVVMVGEGRDEIGNTAIHVGVRTAGDLANIPKVLDGLPVVAQVIGEVDALPATRPDG